MTRIVEDMEYKECIEILSEGSQGARALLLKAILYDHYGAGVLFFACDHENLVGEQMWAFFQDECAGDLLRFTSRVLRGDVPDGRRS